MAENKKLNFRLPEHPEKILDAPDIRDDYYLNLLDYGENDMLAVCLAGSLYLLDSQQQTTNLMNLEEGYISSVAWMQSSNIVAIGLSDSSVRLKSFSGLNLH